MGCSSNKMYIPATQEGIAKLQQQNQLNINVIYINFDILVQNKEI